MPITNANRVLTTTIKSAYPAWKRRTEAMPGWAKAVEHSWNARVPNSIMEDVSWALLLFRTRDQYDVIVTGFERMAWIFALLQRLPGIARTPHVFTDAHPYLPTHSLARWAKRILLRQILLSGDRIVTLSKLQKKIWSKAFSIPEDRFAVIPYWTAVGDASSISRRGDYIFAGGDTERDYPTLLSAAEHLPYRVIISAFDRTAFNGLTIPSNVEIVSTSQKEYLELFSNAALIVVPLRKNTLRFAGQQTYLSAMAMGKPVIVADAGADEYIQNGETGIVVEPGNAVELRHAILRTMQDVPFAERIARQGQVAAAKYTAKRYFDSVLALADECAAQ